MGTASDLAVESTALPRRGASSRHVALALLVLIFAASYLDRQILSVLQESIKHDLGLSDSELGLLTGFGFALFYALFGIPVARLADHWQRRKLIAVCIVAWSMMTALSGAAKSFPLLLSARVGVAVGEAGCNPASYSLISDLYDRRHRATALSVYNVGSSIGIIIGFFVGPWLDHTFGWRTTFVLVGLPGILLAVGILLWVREPQRKGSAEPPLRLNKVLRMLWDDPVLRRLAPALAISTFISTGPAIWAVPYLMRAYGIPLGTIGAWMALALGVGSMVGMLAVGTLADRLSIRDNRWYVWLSAITLSIMCPAFILAYLAGDAVTAMAALSVPFALSGTFAASCMTVLHQRVPPKSRATASAISLLIGHVFGAGLLVWVVGIVSDLLAPGFGQESIRYALLIVVPGACAIAIGFYLYAVRWMSSDNADRPGS